jgi:hypothetical protein
MIKWLFPVGQYDSLLLECPKNRLPFCISAWICETDFSWNAATKTHAYTEAGIE